MTPRNLLILLVLGIAALAGGWYFGTVTTPVEHRSVNAGELMFPDLAEKLQTATRIEVVHQGKPLVIERKGEHWGLADRAGYPVPENKLRSMLTALTELRLVEPRTADPTEFATLGVEDPDGKTSNSNLLRILDGSGKALVAVIVGHRRVRTQGDVPDQVYVRRPGENQSWLAEGSLEVDADPQLWLDRDIMNIDHSRIAKVAVTHGAEALTFTRTGDKLALATPADHPKLDDYKVEDVARALELLTFEDVRPDNASPEPPMATSVFTTTDGLTVSAQVFPTPKDPLKPSVEGEIAVRFSVTDEDKAKPEATRLATRLSGWTYRLGAWKEKALAPSLADLETPPPAPTPAPATGEGAAKP